MSFVELKNKVQSVRNTIDSLINEVIDLKSQVLNISIFDKEGRKLLNYLQKMEIRIQKCQDTVEVVTTKIHGMQQKSHYISNNQASELETEKYSIQTDFDILAAKYNETYSTLVEKSFWANLQDAWQRFTKGISTLAAKVLIWSFTGLIRPMFPASKKPKFLIPYGSLWERIFRN
ncbi:hypothetical protein [Mastigocoleus testarum]|uniref:Uncharacterized protein n=1 Tax=Mastigocoleus testarum BC008 TaxID=371196 RepID=A0A0V7ZGX9_9CYAN|nr:hypothetical protein [Mastigocoleus testarum]KST63844.1 hypothetical protein BC008_15425 [Mastigocoleus testarum BC008]